MWNTTPPQPDQLRVMPPVQLGLGPARHELTSSTCKGLAKIFATRPVPKASQLDLLKCMELLASDVAPAYAWDDMSVYNCVQPSICEDPETYTVPEDVPLEENSDDESKHESKGEQPDGDVVVDSENNEFPADIVANKFHLVFFETTESKQKIWAIAKYACV